MRIFIAYKKEKIMNKRILFISGSVGLGHVRRDLSIAREMRNIKKNIQIDWLAGDPAKKVIIESGEELLKESEDLGQDSQFAEKISKGQKMNVNRYLFSVLKEWYKTVKTIRKVTNEKEYDLIIGDEVYELIIAFLLFPRIKKAPYVMIYDFLGIEPMSKGIIEKAGTYFWNLAWVLGNKAKWVEDLSLFVGNEEDVPDRSFGFMLPNFRDHSIKHYKFVGNIISFDPKKYANKQAVREKLGIGQCTLVVCTVGGTAIGTELLNLCAKTYSILKKEINDIHMVIVCGPRIDTSTIITEETVSVLGYVPNLYEYFAASDLAIVQGGGTTTMELTSLNKKFIYFPLAEHYEQEVVSERLKKMNVGIRLEYANVNSEILASEIISALSHKNNQINIGFDGAVKAAEHICRMI